MFFTHDLFDDVIRLRDVVDGFFKTVPVALERVRTFPYVNVYEKGDRIEIRAMVPGVPGNELNVELVENRLIIEGERRPDEENRNYIRSERNFGHFRRVVELPYRVAAESIQAVLNDGILTITLEKSEEAKPKRIAIN